MMFWPFPWWGEMGKHTSSNDFFVNVDKAVSIPLNGIVELLGGEKLKSWMK